MSTIDRLQSIETPKITRKLELGKFHEAYKELHFDVWVNLPKTLEDAYHALQRKTREKERALRQYVKVLNGLEDQAEIEKINAEVEKLNEEIRQVNDEVYAWYGEVWGEEPEKVRQFAKQCLAEGMRSLWKYVQTETWALIVMHLEGFEKN